MHQQQVLNQMDRERREVTSDGIARQVVPGVVRWRTSDNKHHWIGYSALAELDADETIRREIAHYRQLGLSCERKLYAHDQPADLLERLKRAGFEIGPREAVV